MCYNKSMVTQKLYRNGNSVAVTIPKEYLKSLKLRDGSQVEVKTRGQELVVTAKAKKAEASGVDVKFMKMVDEFVNDHEDVLKELSNR
jgi:putative addiction module antidote